MRNFRKFLLQGKKWQRFQNCNFHLFAQIFVAAGQNHSYIGAAATYIANAATYIGAAATYMGAAATYIV